MDRWSLEVLSTRGREGERWRNSVAALPTGKRDVFFLPEYSSLYQDLYNEPAFLCRYGDGERGVLMPIALRDVGELPFIKNGPGPWGGHCIDATSPYGYGGPLIYGERWDGHDDVFIAFRERLHEYAIANDVVTEFLRLHPLMENHRLFGESVSLYRKNSVVWIDLRGTEADILRGMRKDHRRNVAKAVRKGVEIVRSDLRRDDLKEFHRLYIGTMERRNALSIYMFPLEFVEEAARTLAPHISLFFAKWEGKAVSAYLVLHDGLYVHNFLSGTDSSYWRLKPEILMTHEIALWAKTQGYEFYNLGGGHASETDTLFDFKRGFSPNLAPYYMYRHVHDPETYERLCALKSEFDGPKSLTRDSEVAVKDPLLVGYFPAYRG